MTVAIYTALFGSVTQLKEPHKPSSHVDLVAFTDDEPLRHGEQSAWRIVPRAGAFKSPRMSSKWFRMNSDLVLPEYDTTIWVDASFQLGAIDAFVELCESSLDGKGTAFFLHPERSSVSREAEASFDVWAQKYKGQPLIDQVIYYRASGMPDDYGLWAGGIQIRDNREPWVKELNRLWFAECMRWSEQDQLSLPFVLWSMNRLPGVIPGNVYQGPQHAWIPSIDS